jgi:hypothetical protein
MLVVKWGLMLLALLLAGCAGSAPEVATTPGITNNPSVAVFTPVGMGHGCPVGSVIYTARHVVEDAKRGFFHTTWSDAAGHSGKANLARYSNFADIAILVPSGIQPRYIETGEPTDTLYFWEYDYTPGKLAMRDVRRKAKYTRTVAGHIVFDGRALPGSSGSCLLNDRGEAVGIIVWTLGEDPRTIGIAVKFPKEGL